MWLMTTLELYKNEINDGFKTWSDHFKGRKLVFSPWPKVTKCYEFKIELKMVRKHQDNTETKTSLVFGSVIKHSEVLHCLRVVSPHFSAGDSSLPPPTFYFCCLCSIQLTHPLLLQGYLLFFKLLWALPHLDFCCWSTDPFPHLWME